MRNFYLVSKGEREKAFDSQQLVRIKCVLQYNTTTTDIQTLVNIQD